MLSEYSLFYMYFLLILRFLYSKKALSSKLIKNLSKKEMKIFCRISIFFTIWVMTINIFLIVICSPIILNPGPVITGLFQNVRGFVPFQKLNERVLPTDTAKLQDLQSSVYSRNPALVILNETWLSPDHSDNDILSDNFSKLYRLDRSEKNRPYDPSNSTKFRKRGGGVLIGVRTNLDIKSKVVGKHD